MSAGVFQTLVKAFQLPLALKLREKSITLKSGERKERKKKSDGYFKGFSFESS